MNELINWMKEILDESGPDMSSALITEGGKITLQVLTPTQRVCEMARALSNEGFKVKVVSCGIAITGW
jgi:hypothetical protein